MMRGGREFRIWPKNAFVTSVLGFTGRKLLVTLYASHRNSSCWLSLNWNIRDKATSKSHCDGLTTLRVPTFPNVPTGGFANPVGSCAVAFLSQNVNGRAE